MKSQVNEMYDIIQRRREKRRLLFENVKEKQLQLRLKQRKSAEDIYNSDIKSIERSRKGSVVLGRESDSKSSYRNDMMRYNIVTLCKKKAVKTFNIIRKQTSVKSKMAEKNSRVQKYIQQKLYICNGEN